MEWYVWTVHRQRSWAAPSTTAIIFVNAMFVLCGSRSAIALMCCNRSCYEVPCAALVWSSQCMHTGNMNSLQTCVL